MHANLKDDFVCTCCEYAIQITGGPQAARSLLKILRDWNKQYPWHQQRDKNHYSYYDREAMFNPDKFCFGTGVLSSDKPRKITYQKQFNLWLLDVEGRFGLPVCSPVHCWGETSIISYGDRDLVVSWQLHRLRTRQRWASVSARTKPTILWWISVAHHRNYQCTFYELLAMIRQLGMPTWFFTLSAADVKWSDMTQTIAKHWVWCPYHLWAGYGIDLGTEVKLA